jgi:hypothetical protein
MIITSYEQAAAFFAGAKSPEKGRPLSRTMWRLFKDGDTYVVKCSTDEAVRITPDNVATLHVGQYAPRKNVLWGLPKVTPIYIHKRSEGNYRVHIRRTYPTERYNKLSDFNLTGFTEFSRGGNRLFDGLEVDLSSGWVLNAVSDNPEVDADARKKWLFNSAKLKRHLLVITRLGGFDALVQQVANAGNGTPLYRWELPTLRDISKHPDRLALFVAALEGDKLQEFTYLVAQSMVACGECSDQAIQLAHINNIFTKNSVTLRVTLGVLK